MSGNIFRTSKPNTFFGKNEIIITPSNNIFGKDTIVVSPDVTISSSVTIIFSENQWVYDNVADNYVYTILEGVHGNGLNTYLNIYEFDGNDFIGVTVDSVSIDISGNYEVRCNFPFDGKFIIST